MAIPLKYNIGNIMSRKVSAIMTILGIGIVIAVMVAMMALYNGVQQALVSSGSEKNMIVLREGAQTEATSWVTREKYRIIQSLPGIAKGSDGDPLVSPELVIIFKLPRRDNPTGSNINVRGVTPEAFELRPYIGIVDGRMFRPGLNEVIVSRRMQKRFLNTGVGESFKFGTQTWTVVGVFDADGTSFDSEMWTDVEQLSLAQNRPQYSSVLLKPVDATAFRSIADAVSTDNRLKLLTKTEYKYYEDQTQGLLGLRVLVTIVTFFMVLGATLGAMNTMFSAVASRKRELATMRALGFKRRDVLLSVVIEAIVVSGIAGVAGVLLALPVNGIATGTANFLTFSEVAFNFSISPEVAGFAIALAIVAGVIGGLLPAISAARLPITKALREI
ncbi:MAG TPA: ABC transporter permease [Thermoanaerobaculia bacterium]|nr:ABC transporter permease [Thermoanaerobaculia bacterium]